jgi:hypothetical protein
MKWTETVRRRIRAFVLMLAVVMGAENFGRCAEPGGALDPVLDLFIQKGFITQQEVEKVKAEAESKRTNSLSNTALLGSKWKLSDGLKQIELFGDIRARYEDRSAEDPTQGRNAGNIDLQRFRYAVRLGLRGTVAGDFYYGLRLDTSANPRSPWVTLGTSSSGTPYQGPFGKSTAGINIGQAYLGWHPGDWIDLTVGKMPNPLYTTPMVWDSDLNPEGAAEHFKYLVGAGEIFLNFGQFLYQDVNPNTASGGLGINGLTGEKTDNVFQFAWQGGLKYSFTTNLSSKIAGTLYYYSGLKRSSATTPANLSPFFGDPYVGEGASLLVPGNAGGYSGFGTSSTLPGYQSLGFPINQVGLNHLMIVEVPFELNYKASRFNTRVFGDVAYNLEGAQRARDAAAGYTVYLSQALNSTVKSSPFSPQTHDVKAYQFGIGIGSRDLPYGPMQGVVYGNSCRRHAWELRTYWQHIEQYALDPNLLDSDFFEGRGNLEGVYAALAYGLSENIIATARYGYAQRINNKLGTGGSNQDIPQMNPIEHFNLIQFDLTFRF